MKKWSHLSSSHASFLSYCNFVVNSARNLSLLKQFTYMDLKVLITVFEKIIWFIGVWATVRKIFLLRSAQYWKHALFWQFKDHNSRRELENYTKDQIFSSTFSALPACNIHLWICSYSQVFNRHVPPPPLHPRLLIFRKFSTQDILIPHPPSITSRKMFQPGHL